jgi:hypothetical protein
VKHSSKKYQLSIGLLSIIILATLSSQPVSGQWPFGVPTTPQAQRNAVSALRSQFGWLENATRVVPTQGAVGYANVWETFQGLRQAYNAVKSTLNPQQAAYGANQLAELDAGLDIIQEAFSNYQEDLASGRPPGPALRDMSRVVRQGSGLWMSEFNKTCTQLHIGWGS